jgi:hypothetical protein
MPTDEAANQVTEFTDMKLHELTLWSWAPLDRSPVVRPLDSLPAFHWTWRFLTTFTSAPHLLLFWARPIQSTSPHPISQRAILILFTEIRLGLHRGLFPCRFLTYNLYVFLFFPIRATCPTHLIHLYFISLIMLGEEYKSRSSSLCSFLNRPATCCTVRQHRQYWSSPEDKLLSKLPSLIPFSYHLFGFGMTFTKSFISHLYPFFVFKSRDLPTVRSYTLLPRVFSSLRVYVIMLLVIWLQISIINLLYFFAGKPFGNHPVQRKKKVGKIIENEFLNK